MKLIILSTMRSGSSYLVNTIDQIEHFFDDWNFVDQEHHFETSKQKIFDTDVVLFRFHHIGIEFYRPPEMTSHVVEYWNFIEALSQKCDKVLLHSRQDVFDMTVSRELNEMEYYHYHYPHTFPNGRVTLNINRLKLQYHINCMFVQLWKQHWERVIPKSKLVTSCYESLNENPVAFNRFLSEISGLEIIGTPDQWAPISYKDVITNWDDIQQLKLELTYDR